MQKPNALVTQLPKVKRVLVLGSSGSGKTTMAKFLSERLGVPHLELDACFHEANWTPAAPEVFLGRVEAVVGKGEWAACGNYSLVRDRLVTEAEVIVWLDLPFQVVFSRVVRRTFRRCFEKEELWNGNRERLWPQFFSRDSLFLYVIKSHRRRKQQFESILPKEKTLRLKSPKEVAEFKKRVSEFG